MTAAYTIHQSSGQYDPEEDKPWHYVVPDAETIARVRAEGVAEVENYFRLLAEAFPNKDSFEREIRKAIRPMALHGVNKVNRVRAWARLIWKETRFGDESAN